MSWFHGRNRNFLTRAKITTSMAADWRLQVQTSSSAAGAPQLFSHLAFQVHYFQLLAGPHEVLKLKSPTLNPPRPLSPAPLDLFVPTNSNCLT